MAGGDHIRARRARRGALMLLAALLALCFLEALPAPAMARGEQPSVTGVGAPGGQEPAPTTPPPQPSSFAVGIRLLRLVDGSRSIRLPDGRVEPRALPTYVRYPALGTPGPADVWNAPAARPAGSFPLVVFAHGFAGTPGLYSSLLRSWARAGYVVAAPVFPLESASAPGGPDESDLINEPTDVRFVITRLLIENSAAASPLAGLLDPLHIAVAGHSDGAETALAVAYSRRFRDPRVSAAVIMSGAEISGIGGYAFPRGGPALLATQGTADRSNEPRFTNAYFKLVRRPKYLLRLLGAGHLPPYTYEQPQLAIVKRVTLAFLDTYLKHTAGALQRLVLNGSVPRTSALRSEPSPSAAQPGPSAPSSPAGR
jgi:dienelactone hydrolase